MNQASIELALPPSPSVDRTGFDIGWDHAHHGLVPPADLAQAASPVCQGWMAGKAVYGRRTLPTRRSTRQWLDLRLQAWQEGVAFEGQLVTANYLGQLHTEICPILRVAMGGVAGSDDAAVIDRIDPQAPYAAGNLVVMSSRAAAARRGISCQQAVRRARAAELSGQAVEGLAAAAWWRLATLAAFAQPLPFADAARLPLALLPPNRVRVRGTAQGLQALLTRFFATTGWSARCAALARMLPEHTLRHDFNLFVGAMAPRVLEASADTDARRVALEDAWLHERVQRRWQHLLLSLGEPGAKQLLSRAAQEQLPGVRLIEHATAAEVARRPRPSSTRPAPGGRAPAVRRSPAQPVASASARSSRPGTTPPPAAPATHA
jgi:hypothetical protein